MVATKCCNISHLMLKLFIMHRYNNLMSTMKISHAITHAENLLEMNFHHILELMKQIKYLRLVRQWHPAVLAIDA